MQVNEFQTAIANKDWSTFEMMVVGHLDGNCSRDGLADWLEEGSYTGSETVESIAAEWMELETQIEGVDY